MSINFQELDSQPTILGEISLRRRRLLQHGGIEVFEIKLNDEFLMSSMFHAVEDALSDLALGQLSFTEMDVVVGGLGLGYTAVAALKSARVRSLIVIDLLQPVIDWHHRGLCPLGPTLTNDRRCRLVQGDFFASAMSTSGLDPIAPARKFHAILLDIDHSPEHFLNPAGGSFYSAPGMSLLAQHLVPGGIFALWSDDDPEEKFLTNFAEVFSDCQARVVEFANPLRGGTSRGTIYHGRVQGQAL